MSGPHVRKHRESLNPVGPTLQCARCLVASPINEFRIVQTGARASYCRACQVASVREWRARNREQIAARRRAAYPRPGPRSCTVCQREFQPGNGNQVYCSPACKRTMQLRHMNPRRREAHVAMMRLSPLVVAEHGMVCHLCTGRIEQGLHYLDGGALTIDHIVPLSRGGTDDLANLRPAHRRCNIAKRDRDGLTEDQQLVGYLKAELAIRARERLEAA